MNNIRNVLSIILLLASFVAAAQDSKEELQRKKELLLKEIEAAKQEVADTKEGKRSVIGDLRVIEKNIDRRTSVINNIKGEVYFVEKDIIKTYRDIDTLKKELGILKDQYAQSVIYAYKNRSNYDFLNFLFSAGNFGDVLRRISYLKTYRGFREQKAGDITRTQELMKNKVSSLTVKRQEKTSALQEQSKQMAELANEKKQKDVVIAQLNSKEKELNATISKKQKQQKDIQNAIQAVIRRELAEEKARAKREADALAKQKAAREAEARRIAAANNAANNNNNPTASNTKPANTNPTTTPETKPAVDPASTANLTKPVQTKTRQASELETTPEVVMVSQNFEGNKGNMPWPVDKGVISYHYGMNRVGKVTVPSDGITIETAIGAPVKAIFDGEIASVSNIGDTKIVIIKHGKYFTTYSNLQNANVSRGQKVSRGQVLGSAAANDEGVGETYLQMDTERGTINPEAWIKNR
jgi:septal ring factor EnvC (AmiA/AmiB activator)